MTKFIINMIEEKLLQQFSAKQILSFVWIIMKIIENGGELQMNNLELSQVMKTSHHETKMAIRDSGLFDVEKVQGTAKTIYKLKPEIKNQMGVL